MRQITFSLKRPGAATGVQKIPGVVRVRQTFPGDSDPEMQLYYTADVETSRQEEIASAISSLDDVESVQVCAPKVVQCGGPQ